jgi:predicted nuclease with TOPRIM domain
MLWAKNTYKSVTFTQEAADQSLLTNVEQELGKQLYESFSDLCKQALWKFLSKSDATSSEANSSELVEQLAELQRKLAEMEQGGVSLPPSGRENLSSQSLSELQRKVVQLEMRLSSVESNRGDRSNQSLDLDRKIVELESRLKAAESSRFELLEGQLKSLAEKLDRLLQIQIDRQLAGEMASLPVNQSTMKTPSKPEPEPEPPAPVIEVSEDAIKLSKFLDSF